MTHGTQNARRRAVDAAFNGRSEGWHAYASGPEVVWAHRVDDTAVVLIQPQDDGLPFPMDARHFDRIFRPTADQTPNQESNS